MSSIGKLLLHDPRVFKLSRRQLLLSGAATIFGLGIGACSKSSTRRAAQSDVVISSFVTISTNNTVVITVPDIEMGQNIFTTLSKIIADELGADWSTISVKIGGGDPVFANPLKGYQATGRSQSVRGFYQPLRMLGATIREMLIQVAAERWSVPIHECTSKKSYIIHTPTDRRLRYSELAEAAAKLPMPTEPRLRPDTELEMIGKTTPRLDTALKSRGEAIYTIDLDLPDMLSASIRHAPVLGTSIEQLDNESLIRQTGVHSVVVEDNYIAVVAERFYQAKAALDSARLSFTANSANEISSADYQTQLEQSLNSDMGIKLDDGPDIESQNKDLVASYWVPFLAHATMEPMTAVARFENGSLELWASTQGPFIARAKIAKKLGIDPQAITIHRPFAGGGFGRRFFSDFCIQAAVIAHSVPGRPIKLIWSREQDMAHDYYRPAVAARLIGSLNETGKLTGLTAQVSGASIRESMAPGSLKGKVDRSLFSGLADCPYDFVDRQFVWHKQSTPIRIGMWRAVSNSQNAFFLESFIDECASAAGVDPAKYRLSLCGKDTRLRNVIEKVTEISDWSSAQNNGSALGIAVVKSYGSYVAQVAEVEVVDKKITVKKVWCVIDCGQAIDPGGVRAQMEGGIIYGLSAALFGEITINKGRVAQSNFHNYRILQAEQAPDIKVVIINSGAELGGVGEPGLPPVAPAVGNAIFAAVGTRLRQLPLRL
ncbi:MAG: molybdopterin cofactor-binding domain-containing protein [Pseudomonadales bacterium]|jgi:isoquinoline 1-oxidoreductase beta subunit|tara:strand:+ start:16 stop:2160 length:2145 start_codon:yes stop_codon:yes gene_type:complete